MKIDLFDVPNLIAFISQGITLTPGDIIFTGTPPGVGAFRYKAYGSDYCFLGPARTLRSVRRTAWSWEGAPPLTGPRVHPSMPAWMTTL